jgi:hypothetical protein
VEAAQHVKSDTREQPKRHEEVGTDSITFVCAPAACSDDIPSSVRHEFLVILHFLHQTQHDISHFAGGGQRATAEPTGRVWRHRPVGSGGLAGRDVPPPQSGIRARNKQNIWPLMADLRSDKSGRS